MRPLANEGDGAEGECEADERFGIPSSMCVDLAWACPHVRSLLYPSRTHVALSDFETDKVRGRLYSDLDEYGAARDVDDDAADPCGVVGGEDPAKC